MSISQRQVLLSVWTRRLGAWLALMLLVVAATVALPRPAQAEPAATGTLALQIKDRQGVWRDADAADDFPSFYEGDTVTFRARVTNTGTATATNVEVTSSGAPGIGSFTIDSIPAGGTETRTFEVTLDSATPDTAITQIEVAAGGFPSDQAGLNVVGTLEVMALPPSGSYADDGLVTFTYYTYVMETSGRPTSFRLDEALLFGPGVEVESSKVQYLYADSGEVDGSDWNGLDHTGVGSDIPMPDGGAFQAHFEVKFRLPLRVPGAGSEDFDPTGCPVKYGFSFPLDEDTQNQGLLASAALTDPTGTTIRRGACYGVHSIELGKSVVGQPTANPDGTWTVNFDLGVTNNGAGATYADITDVLAPQAGFAVKGVSASEPTGIWPLEPDWDGTVDHPTLVKSGGVYSDAPANLTADVVIEVPEGVPGQPESVPCELLAADTPGLRNTMTIDVYGETDESSACLAMAEMLVEKEISSGPTANGDGTWSVTYLTTVENVGDIADTYTLNDRFRFGEGIEIVGNPTLSVDDEDVVVNPDWTGRGPEGDAANVLAADQTVALDGTHTYETEVTFRYDEDVASAQDYRCPAPGTEGDGGLAATVTLDHHGTVVVDEVCDSIPLFEIDKAVVGEPVANGDGTWDVTYEVGVHNYGGAVGTYDLVDRLLFGAGVETRSAKVIASPEGVSPNATWSGQAAAGSHANIIAADVALPASGHHDYTVTAVVAIDESTATPESFACPANGSGKPGGLASQITVSHDGDAHAADACTALPLIHIDKELRTDPVAIDGDPGTFEATYTVDVTNHGPGAGVYDLTDTLRAGDGVRVLDVVDLRSDAPSSLGPNSDFDGLKDTGLVQEQRIDGSTGDPVRHRYSLTVRYAVDPGAKGPTDITGCATPDGSAVPGALASDAQVTWNGTPEGDSACVRHGGPSLETSVISADPIGQGRWQVDYAIRVAATSPFAATYSLDQQLLFAPSVTVLDLAVTGPASVGINGNYDGDEDVRIATDVALGGQAPAARAAAEHQYRVSALVEIPLHLEGDESGVGSPACTAPAGSNALAQALNVATTLSDSNGGTTSHSACAPLPSFTINHAVLDQVSDEGSTTVTYRVAVANDGAASGRYSLTDRLAYAEGVRATAIAITAPDGVEASSEWTGLAGDEGAQAISSDVELPAGVEHVYLIDVTSTVPTGLDESVLECRDGVPNSGLASVATIVHNGLTRDSETCADLALADSVNPALPSPPRALPGTGIDLGWAAWLMVAALVLGRVLLTVFRRSS